MLNCKAIVIMALLTALPLSICAKAQVSSVSAVGDAIVLPEPKTSSEVSLEEALSTRRSVRSFSTKPLALADISQLCWAAQGVTDKQRGLRTAPSAGALYLVTSEGVFHYIPASHSLQVVSGDDIRPQLGNAALRQSAVSDGAGVFVFAAVYERTSEKYGERAQRYVQIEVGHAAENLMLQAVALKLGSVAVGAFDDNAVSDILNLPPGQVPLLIIPVGHPE